MNLYILPELYAICRLDPVAAIPSWTTQNGFYSITRTSEELSIVCLQSSVPSSLQYEGNWRMLKVAATLDFSLTGVLASLVSPLAEAEISIFSISTFDTDYLLVKASVLEHAVNVLHAAGHNIKTQ